MPENGVFRSTNLTGGLSQPKEDLILFKFGKIRQNMRTLPVTILLAMLAAGCQQPDAISEFTGNENTYDLQQGSAFAVSGTITFKERKDGKITAVVKLTGTDGGVKHPVHLHLGDISNPGADVALLMNPVVGKTGLSETTFDALSDETRIVYSQLNQLEACVKIHLGETGADRDVILAAGNIGASFAKASLTSRQGVATCKSE